MLLLLNSLVISDKQYIHTVSYISFVCIFVWLLQLLQSFKLTSRGRFASVPISSPWCFCAYSFKPVLRCVRFMCLLHDKIWKYQTNMKMRKSEKKNLQWNIKLQKQQKKRRNVLKISLLIWYRPDTIKNIKYFFNNWCVFVGVCVCCFKLIKLMIILTKSNIVSYRELYLNIYWREAIFIYLLQYINKIKSSYEKRQKNKI